MPSKFRICLAAAAVLLGFGLNGAELKIAVVNSDLVFRTYYRTGQLEKQLKQQSQVYRDYIARESNKLRDLQQKFQVERDKSQNLAISESERKKSAGTAEKYARDFQSLETQLSTYVADKEKELAALQARSRKEIYDEIGAAVKSCAADRRLDLVLDSSGAIPMVLYHAPSLDLTDQIIAILNKSQKQ